MLIKSQVALNSLDLPTYGMESPEVWDIRSKRKDKNIVAPCNFDLFMGVKATYNETIRAEVRGGN